MIAVAGWLVWTTDRRSHAMVLWGIALALKAAWSWVFFGWQWIGGALVDINLLWLSIAAFIVAAWPVSRIASLLFIPYLCWLAFATALNTSIWLLNR